MPRKVQYLQKVMRNAFLIHVISFNLFNSISLCNSIVSSIMRVLSGIYQCKSIDSVYL